MKQYIIAILLLLSGSVLFAQDAKTYIHQGNELYSEKKYKDAEAAYRKSVAKKNQSLEGNFNLGDALYKQKRYDDAVKNFNDIAAANSNPLVKAGAYHNLGNSLLSGKKYDESIDAYKKALLNNPKDDETRYNLAYAQEMLKKQQQQNKQNQQNNQNNNQNSKDKNKSDKNNQDKKNQDKNNQNKNDQNKDQNQQNKDQQDKKDQQNQQQPNKVSKDDAQRMLDALNNQEQGTQDKLKGKKVQGTKTHIDKDW